MKIWVLINLYGGCLMHMKAYRRKADAQQDYIDLVIGDATSKRDYEAANAIRFAANLDEATERAEHWVQNDADGDWAPELWEGEVE